MRLECSSKTSYFRSTSFLVFPQFIFTSRLLPVISDSLHSDEVNNGASNTSGADVEFFNSAELVEVTVDRFLGLGSDESCVALFEVHGDNPLDVLTSLLLHFPFISLLGKESVLSEMLETDTVT